MFASMLTINTIYRQLDVYIFAVISTAYVLYE